MTTYPFGCRARRAARTAGGIVSLAAFFPKQSFQRRSAAFFTCRCLLRMPASRKAASSSRSAESNSFRQRRTQLAAASHILYTCGSASGTSPAPDDAHALSPGTAAASSATAGPRVVILASSCAGCQRQSINQSARAVVVGWRRTLQNELARRSTCAAVSAARCASICTIVCWSSVSTALKPLHTA